MWQRFTENARSTVYHAQEEAAGLGENYVGTEHLLLGLIRVLERASLSTCAKVLKQLKIPLELLRSEIERQVTRGHGNLGQELQLTPRAKRTIDLAYEEARQLNTNHIGMEHLLLGLIREGDCLAARTLVKHGADLLQTRKVVYGLVEREPQGKFEEPVDDGWDCELPHLLESLPEALQQAMDSPHGLSLGCLELEALDKVVEALIGRPMKTAAEKARIVRFTTNGQTTGYGIYIPTMFAIRRKNRDKPQG